MDVEDYLQQFTTTTAPNEEKLSQNETSNNSSININELINLQLNTNNSGEEEVISPKLDGDEKPSADVAVVADVACGGDEVRDSVKADGVADVACGGDSELTDSVEADGKECGESGGADDVACGGNSELMDSVKVDGVADVACGGNSDLTDSVKVDGKECGESGGADDVACGGNSELMDSVKVDGVDDVACGVDSELTETVKADGVECEETVADDVACGGNSMVTDSVKVDGVADVACGGNSELTETVKADGVADVACGGGELTETVKVDGKECGDSAVADDVACGGNSELTDSVKVDGFADVACGSGELTDSGKVDGVECEKTGVDDVACGGSELTKECEDKIIGESELEDAKMDVTNDIEVAKEGEAVTEGQNDAVEGVVADDVAKQNDEGDDMVTDCKDDVNEGVKAELVADDVVKQNDEGDDMVTDRKDDVNEGVEAEIVADKEEGKMDVVEKQNDDEEEEVEAVKRRGRPRKREGSPVKRRGQPKKRERDSSKATPKSTSVKMSDSEEDDDDEDEDFEAVATPSSKKRRGRPKKNGGNSAKATPKSTSVKMVEKEEEAENKDVETKSPDLPIKRRGRGRPKKSEGNSAKAAPKSTSVKMIEEDEDVEAVETELPDAPVKKLGRPRKSGGNSQKATPKSASAKMIEKKKEEEDVCFICFDGGELVLCDKKDCPKAYHHSCVDRDEAFFQTKGNWNCGWHLCSICAKKAKYMCYTCTFSLCKACAKTNVIFCVREEEKKGFCEPCMKIVMLIENKSQETQEGVDFDDKDSWEYMFKEYWTDLKPKLNISLAELLEAKTACKGSSPVGEQEPPAVHSDGGSGSENPSENPESQTKKKSRKSKKQKTIDSAVIASEGTPVPESENTEWATEELLEFVAHMGNNKSYQSQFDVQALLLEYIKTNKLRDPRKKSQIICDARLTRLFNKPRVGHFEMLKLLESHFLIKEDSQIDKSAVDTEVGLGDDDEDYETAKRDGKDKKRKIRKKADREPQSNREDFAAIDVHNINLIYLKRKFLEDLLDDTETFNSKVVGTFVRIRIQGANNKQDIYRLVQVTGTTKGEHYAVGKKMTDTMLEILNLDKTESVSIDIISNHDFTEDECKRLRQSMKCGLIKSPKVGDILDKAIELQAVRVNDWLEAEVVRISHLRDRASDLGRKKELRECVEKLQLLKTPEERARRLQDIPVIHDDSTMDPNHESDNDADENDKKQDMYKSSLSSNSSKRRDYPSKESWSSTGAGTSRSSGKNYELSRNLSDNKVEDVITAACFKPHNENLWDQGRDVVVQPTSILKKPSSTNETEKNMVPTEDVSETEKMWHYRDPSGKIQGPFAMAQLRKWNNSKFFPVDLRTWKKSEKEGDSVLLTDALEGRFSTANLPSPTPNRTIANSGLVVPSVVPSLYHGGNEGLQSPTPLGTGQNLSVRPYSGSGDPQPSPNMGSVNQSMNWGTASQGSWAVAVGPSNVSPGWVASRGPSQGSRGSGNGNSKSVGSSGSSPTARNQGYKRSGFSEDKRDRHRSSGYRDDRRNWDRHRSFNSRRRSRDSDRY